MECRGSIHEHVFSNRYSTHRSSPNDEQKHHFYGKNREVVHILDRSEVASCSTMNDSYILVDDSSDDESIFVNHGLTQTPRKNVLIDSSDDEFTPQRKIKNVMQECIDIDSSDDDAPVGGRSNEDDDLTDKMKKLTMESEDSAWAYDKERNEFLLTRAEFENVDVVWPNFSLPAKLFESLYPHQKVGVQWAASMHSHKIGGIL